MSLHCVLYVLYVPWSWYQLKLQIDLEGKQLLNEHKSIVPTAIVLAQHSSILNGFIFLSDAAV